MYCLSNLVYVDDYVLKLLMLTKLKVTTSHIGEFLYAIIHYNAIL